MKAEVMFTLRTVVKQQPLELLHDVKSFLLAVFPAEQTLEQFSLSTTKATYLIRHALGPYFQQKIKDDIQNGEFHIYYLFHHLLYVTGYF